jgi:hypothetical protein
LRSTPAELEQLINAIVNPDWEPAYEEYGEHLRALNAIVRQSGVRLEGNLFAEHLRDEIHDEPVEIFRNKRRNYAMFCATGSTLLEIGFNAGHSCLLALTINRSLRYTGVDIGMHAYTQPCFDYLKSVFGDRVELRVGDSRDVLPILQGEDRRYDLFHLDGGHGFNVAVADLCNILNFSERPSTLLVDDINDHMIAALCDYYVMRGRISPIRLRKFWSITWDHAFYRIHPADRR